MVAGGETINYQNPQLLWPNDTLADKVRVVPFGTTATYGHWHVTGFAQLVGSILADQAATIVIEGSPLAGGAGTTWSTLYTKVLVAGTLDEFVVDLTADYIRIRVTAPGAPTPDTNIQLQGRFMPVSALESNRSAAAPDVIELEPVLTTHHNAANAVANGTDAILDASHSYVRFQIITTAGIIAATLQFFGSEDGVNFVAVNARNTVTGVIANNSAVAGSANEVWEADVAGLRLFRVRLNAINPAAGVETVTVTSKAVQGATSLPNMSWNEGERVKVNPIAGQVGVAGAAGATNALTQRVVLATDDLVVLATGVPAAAAPTRIMQGGGIYQAVPTVIADGQLGQFLLTAFKRLITAAWNNALGADDVNLVAPVEYDRQVGTARASAALPGAGAFDAAPVEIPTGGHKWLELYVSYDEAGGAANGAVTVRLGKAITVPGVGDVWGRDVIVNSGAFAAGADVTSGVQREQWQYNPTVATAEIFILLFDVSRCDKIRVPCAESGDIANPGTVVVYYNLSN